MTREILPSNVAFYFIVSMTMIGLSGAVATMHGIDGMNAVTIFQLGASVPAMLSTFAGPKDPKPTIELQGAVQKRAATWRDYVNFLAFRAE